tara:strand:- start:112 stop:1257 length:1146 start_codon:yes stop_codon:yes gene_type:complete
MNKFFNLKIVAITHFISRSGTLYLHSLLDNHPQIATIPGTIDIVKILKIKKRLSALECYEIFKENNPKFFDTSSFNFSDRNNSSLWILGDDKKKKILTNENEFKSNFLLALENREITPRNILISLYFAYAKVHNKKIENFKIILMHPHEKKTTLIFNKFFNDAIYLVPIRNPIKAYKSILIKTKFVNKLRGLKYYPSGQLMESALDIKDFYLNKLDMYFLKLEDLNNNLEHFMQKISKLLKIDFNRMMLSSTFGGLKYWGNSVEKQTNNFDNKGFKEQVDLPKNDLKIIYFLNSQLMNILNYKRIKLTTFEKITLPISFLFPLKDEIDFLTNTKKINFQNLFKFIVFFFPKRAKLLLTVFLNNYSSRYSYLAKRLIKNQLN